MSRIIVNKDVFNISLYNFHPSSTTFLSSSVKPYNWYTISSIWKIFVPAQNYNPAAALAYSQAR
jgi:hypothetical protein